MTDWFKQVNSLQEIPDIESFVYNDDGLSFICVFKAEKKKVHFKNYRSMRIIDEGLWLKPSEEKIVDSKTWLYSLDKSEFIDWVNKESLDIYKDIFKHFILITCEDIIEIISVSPPTITSL